MQSIMCGLRREPPHTLGGLAVEKIVDYKAGIHALPKADVLEFQLAGGAKAIIRPSGTEPKMKVYLFGKGRDRQEAKAVLERLRQDMGRRLQ